MIVNEAFIWLSIKGGTIFWNSSVHSLPFIHMYSRARAKEEEEKKTHKSCISQFQVHFFTTLQSPIRAFTTNATERAKPYCAGEDN